MAHRHYYHYNYYFLSFEISACCYIIVLECSQLKKRKFIILFLKQFFFWNLTEKLVVSVLCTWKQKKQFRFYFCFYFLFLIQSTFLPFSIVAFYWSFIKKLFYYVYLQFHLHSVQLSNEMVKWKPGNIFVQKYKNRPKST